MVLRYLQCHPHPPCKIGNPCIGIAHSVPLCSLRSRTLHSPPPSYPREKSRCKLLLAPAEAGAVAAVAALAACTLHTCDTGILCSVQPCSFHCRMMHNQRFYYHPRGQRSTRRQQTTSGGQVQVLRLAGGVVQQRPS